MRFNSGYRFRFRAVPFVATLIVIAIGITLGLWQLRRADQKEAIAVKLAARSDAEVLETVPSAFTIDDAEFRKVRLHGEFLPDWPLYLDNRPYQGRAGLYVLMPFRATDGPGVVLVERGWIARDPNDRARIPVIPTPAGMQTIVGRIRKAPGHVMQLGKAPGLKPGAIVQNLVLAEFSATSMLPVRPFLLEQLSDTGDGLVRDWPRPSAGVERHLGYAFQWFALAAMAAVFFVVTGFRRGKPAFD